MDYYIKTYHWLLKHPELTTLDANIVSHVMGFGLKGCYQTNAELGQLFKKSIRQIQRKINSLVKRRWLARLDLNYYDRILWASPKEPPEGPIEEYKKTVMPKLVESKIQQTSKQLTLW